MMKLYTMPSSRFGDRIRIQILAKRLEVEEVFLAYPFPDAYLRVNPLGQVPALDTGRGILAESAVIAEYLEDLGEGPSLRPDDPVERARMRLLIRLLDLRLAPSLARLYGPLGQEHLPEIGQALAGALAAMAGSLDAGAYAVGERLTLADCALMPILMRLRLLAPRAGLADPMAEGPVADYYAATRGNRAVAAILDEAEPALLRALSAS